MNNSEKYCKRLIIHDMEQQEFLKQFFLEKENTLVLSKNTQIVHCTGCFGCWVKTPAVCVIKDGFQDQGKRLCKINELILISRCTYGGFSPFVKNVLDRSIGCMLPFFYIKNREIHHIPRTKNRFRLRIHLYGSDITQSERETAIKLAEANALNFNALDNSVHFYSNSSDIREENV